MATIILRPTDGSVNNLVDNLGEEGTIDVITDNNPSTYLTTSDETDGEFSILSIAFQTSQVYNEENAASINHIIYNIQGKVLQDSAIPLQFSLTCTHRGQEGVNIQSPLTAFTTGTIALAEQYTNLANPNALESIDDGHIDTLVANISVEEGSFLISEVFIEVDYTPITAGRIEIPNGFIELRQGQISVI